MNQNSALTFPSLPQGFNATEIAFLAIAALGILMLLLIYRKVGRSSGAGKEQERHSAELETRLGDALRNAERVETIVSEREQSIDQLRAHIQDLSDSAANDQNEIRDLVGRNASLEAKQKAVTETLLERRRELEKSAGEIIKLRARIEEEQQNQQGLKSRISALETQLDAEKTASEAKIALLSKVRDDMQERFRQLADEALKTQGEAFSKANVEKLEATLTPLKEHVGHFEKELREVHQETVKDRERLKSEIAQLTQRSEAISHEALALTRALKGDHQKQGAWGEMILESILNRSGLREGEEYVTQAHRKSDEGERLRPDVIVMIPGGKTLVIDSKVSLNDYASAVNAEDPQEALLARKRHVAAMRAHINGLSGKAYQLAEGQSVDYVIMFVPIEGALSEALREDGGLTEYALERQITIATPTTLMMALRTVSHVWAVERRNQNAEDIAKRAGLLYDKVASFVANMEKVGKGLDTAQSAYETAFGQLSRGKGNVLAQVETLKSLGAKASKSLALEFDGKNEAKALAIASNTGNEEPTE